MAAGRGVGLIQGMDDPLDGCGELRAGLFEFAVGGDLGAEGGAGVLTKEGCEMVEAVADGREEAAELIGR